MTAILVTTILVTTILVLAFVCVSRAATKPDSRPVHWVAGKGDQGWQWKWEVWLPDKWRRIGRCETHLTWEWNSGTYQGAFGFHHGSWDRFKPVRSWPSEAYLASPWQQYQTALAIWRRYGFLGWGCRNA